MLGAVVTVPGSVANLGGGFDTLGVAVELYLRVRVVDVRDDGGGRLIVARSTPAVQGANALERAFGAAVHHRGVKTRTVTVEVDSEIPMAAGLGSSAAASVAGVRVFELVNGPLPDRTALHIATMMEGHADNAAPALFGGLQSVVQVEGGEPLAMRWSWPSELKLVVATPAVGLATAKARAALAPTVSRPDAIFNLQRVAALLHALQGGRFDRLREAVGDRWHQPARMPLVPLLEDLLTLDHPDVLGAFLSGAGPSVALLAVNRVTDVAALMESMYERAGVPARVRVLSVHESSSRVLAESLDQPSESLAATQGRTA